LNFPKKILKTGENLAEVAPNNRKNKKVNDKNLKVESKPVNNFDLNNLSKQKILPQNVKIKLVKEPLKSILKKASQPKMEINQHTNQNAYKYEPEFTMSESDNGYSYQDSSEEDIDDKKDKLPMFSH
jgi:hypothetical protein